MALQESGSAGDCQPMEANQILADSSRKPQPVARDRPVAKGKDDARRKVSRFRIGLLERDEERHCRASADDPADPRAGFSGRGLPHHLVTLQHKDRQQLVQVRIVGLVARIVAPELVFPVCVAIAQLQLAEGRDGEAGLLLQGDPLCRRPKSSVLLRSQPQPMPPIAVDAAVGDEERIGIRRCYPRDNRPRAARPPSGRW